MQQHSLGSTPWHSPVLLTLVGHAAVSLPHTASGGSCQGGNQTASPCLTPWALASHCSKDNSRFLSQPGRFSSGHLPASPQRGFRPILPPALSGLASLPELALASMVAPREPPGLHPVCRSPDMTPNFCRVLNTLHSPLYPAGAGLCLSCEPWCPQGRTPHLAQRRSWST